MNVADLTQEEMLSTSGGDIRCWGGGFLAAAGFMTADVGVFVVGVCFIVDYC